MAFVTQEGENPILSSLVNEITKQGKAREAIQVASEVSSPMRLAAIRAVVQNWYDEDSMSASRFIGTMQPSRARDEAVMGIVPSIMSDSDLDTASQWARTVEDQDMKLLLLEMIDARKN